MLTHVESPETPHVLGYHILKTTIRFISKIRMITILQCFVNVILINIIWFRFLKHGIEYFSDGELNVGTSGMIHSYLSCHGVLDHLRLVLIQLPVHTTTLLLFKKKS